MNLANEKFMLALFYRHDEVVALGDPGCPTAGSPKKKSLLD
jgi:hypothetical protein